MRTPKLAVWLLRNLGSGESIEALIGDLTEECERGRSRGWFWWQVGAAITAALFDTIRQHPYLTIRAIAVGWTTLILVTGLVRGGLSFLYPEFPAWVRHAPFFGVAWSCAPLAVAAAAYFVSGRVVALVHRQHRLALVLVTMLSMALSNAIFVVRHTYYMLTHLPGSPLMGRTSVVYSASLLLPLLGIVGGIPRDRDRDWRSQCASLRRFTP